MVGAGDGIRLRRNIIEQLEQFVARRLRPVYKAHYAVWVYWWPLWRNLYSRNSIVRQWQKFYLVREGQTFLDYGCGTGCFSIPAARMVGKKGKVFALDCFPRQLEVVNKRSRKEGLANIEVILSDCETGLPDACVDVVWMCDVFHEVKEKQAVLEELYRVLKREGTLAIHDGMKDKVLSYTEGLFSLSGQDGKLFRFTKWVH